MDKIEYLIGNEEVENKVFEPCDKLLIDFLADLSEQIKNDSRTKEYLDVITFAFWCRRANLEKIKEEVNDRKNRIGIGTILHIAPSNVPINFAFSFAFGLLAGNSNIVRVPSKKYKQIEIICECINKLFENQKYERIKRMTCFLRYPKNDEISEDLSKKCQGRIVWGSDNTIKTFKKMETDERCIDLMFPDRYSICLINSDYIESLNTNELQILAKNFYNDTYLMDQNACSSPKLIIWLGKNNEAIREKFWKSVYEFIKNKYSFEKISAVDKYTWLCEDAIKLEKIKKIIRMENLIYRIEFDGFPTKPLDFNKNCGYFYEVITTDIDNIVKFVNRKCQTLTYFGIDRNYLREFVIKNSLLGIDRIVPIGQALNIDYIWDGYNTIQSLSRIIDVK